MKYPQIMSRVFREPWLIEPGTHRTIQQALMARLSGADSSRVMLPGDDDGEECEDKEEVGDFGGVRVIPVHGILGKHLDSIEMACGGCSLDRLADEIEIAKSDSNVRAVVFDFRSPGGTVSGTPEVADAIAEIGKPTVAFTDSQCCSGALWLASQCDEFYATGSSSIGSVGVYLYLEDHTKALEMEGIKPNPISAGEFKLIGAYFKPLTDAERAFLQAKCDKSYSDFKDAVNSKRPVADEFLQGQVFYGEQAAEHGFLSGLVDDFDEVIEIAALL